MTPTRARRALAVLLDGRLVAQVTEAAGRFRLRYDDAWRADEDAYPLSLSMPLAAAEHGHDPVNAFLWGLLPDNSQTLAHYAHLFGVSAGNPVALLTHMGADCAGAVQLVPSDAVATLTGEAAIEWLTDDDVERELREVRLRGTPGRDARTVGHFSLAGAQPKIALHEADGRWGRPSGRTPTTHILKPPAVALDAFAENEHFCLALAETLGLRAAESRVLRFGAEVAIVVARYDRVRVDGVWHRVHQEDAGQALGVVPAEKYEADGGPGAARLVALVRETSRRPDVDVARLVDLLAFNWLIAGTDAHAKNVALLLGARGGVRLAPFYDLASWLPYTEPRLHGVKLAMRIGGEYRVRRIGARHWIQFAREARLDPDVVLARTRELVRRTPDAAADVHRRAVTDGLAPRVIGVLAHRVRARAVDCLAMLDTST